MAKDKVNVVGSAENGDDGGQGKVSLEVKLPSNEDLVVCKVCGHKNPKNAGLCAMCSNYLF